MVGEEDWSLSLSIGMLATQQLICLNSWSPYIQWGGWRNEEQNANANVVNMRKQKKYINEVWWMAELSPPLPHLLIVLYSVPIPSLGLLL
jgi:hypothetical protein